MRSMRDATEWKVPAVICLALSSPTEAMSLSRISRAALLVKVMHKMCDGGTPSSLMRCVTRPTSTRVLPEPGPARTFMGAMGATIAEICCSFMPSRCGAFARNAGSASAGELNSAAACLRTGIHRAGARSETRKRRANGSRSRDARWLAMPARRRAGSCAPPSRRHQLALGTAAECIPRRAREVSARRRFRAAKYHSQNITEWSSTRLRVLIRYL